MTKTSTSQSRDSDLKINARLIEVGQWWELALFIIFIHFLDDLGVIIILLDWPMMEHAIFDMIVRGSAALIIKKKSSESDHFA